MWWQKISQSKENIDEYSLPMINRETGESEDISIPIEHEEESYKDIIIKHRDTLCNGTAQEVYDYIAKNPSARAGNIASAYILPSGEYILLMSHHHDEVARSILPKILVPPTHDYGRTFVGKINSLHMPIFTGAIRVQLLPDGLGVMIDMANPPSNAQINAIKDYYNMTNGNTFVCEINYKGEQLAWVRSLLDLDVFLNTYNKGNKRKTLREQADESSNIREFLKEQELKMQIPEWYGQSAYAKTYVKNRKPIVFT